MKKLLPKVTKDWIEKISPVVEKFFKKFPDLQTETFKEKMKAPRTNFFKEWIDDKGNYDKDWLRIKDSEEFKELDKLLELNALEILIDDRKGHLGVLKD